MGLKESVDNIIQARKNDIPKVDDKLKTVEKVKTAISKIRSSIQGLDDKHGLDLYIKDLDVIETKVDSLKTSLENVKGRFSRETINIGVSGGARVGKSTLLQTLTGLGNDVIPSGEGVPVTAVGSVIENQAESENQYAKIEFYNEEEFLENRVKPLINGFEGVEGTIKSIEDFIKKELPDVDPKNDVNYARKNVQKGKFKELQGYYDSYKNLLGTGSKSIDLKDIKSYVSYPQEIDATDVYYPAVKSVHIYTHFSSLNDDVKLMLIDLPGFGEIGGVDEIQLKSLNTDIDHAIRIARPNTSQNVYCGEQLAKISESLANVQPEVKDRSCLFSYVVNIEKDNKNYETFCNKHIEGILENEPIFKKGVNLHAVSVIDKEETDAMFIKILDSMVSNMQKLDDDFIKACDTSKIVSELQPISESIMQKSEKLRQRIHTSHENINENADKLINAILKTLEKAEDEWKNKKDAFLDEIVAKKKEIENNLDDNLYYDVSDNIYSTWDEYAENELRRTNNQYAGIETNECIRLRIKILDEYENLSKNYEKTLAELKEEIIKAFRDNLGNLPDKDKTGMDSIDDILFKISKKGQRVERIVECLKWLKNLDVDFMQQIYPSLFVNDDNDDMFEALDYNKNTFVTNDMNSLVAQIKNDLQIRAKRVNQRLKDSLVSNNFYGKYLTCSIRYFSDKLIRFDIEQARRNFANLYNTFQSLINSEDGIGITDDDKIISIDKNALELSQIVDSWGGR